LFPPGTRVGPYEIVSALGAGGMGEVYRARDPRLDRDIAIKILPAAFAADAERLARFHREAKTLASLNHPNIGGIHGIEEANGLTAIVMELVEGEDLAQRIARGAIPIGEALPIARQIAEALEAAHERGIVHRDLKPANVRLRPDGTVKVLDFGLAKAMDPPIGNAASVSQSPTIPTPAMTEAGIILGTAAYMSPEQARGKPVDKRTDIWAFGCVLYEMLTGRRAFSGDDVSDVIASVLAREPDLAAVPAAAPPSIRRLLRRCLQKDRHERLRDIGDARLEISDALARVDTELVVVTPQRADRRGRERLIWIAALAALTLSLAASLIFARRPNAAAAEIRVDIATPPTEVPQSVAISPDGRAIAYVATSDGLSRLWLRSLESGSSRALVGADGAESPFWSPNSQSIGFFADGKLKRVEVAGGSVETVTNAPSGIGGAWNQEDTILFVTLGNPISRVAADGGDPVAITGLARQGSNFSPHFLPDGRRFLYYVRGTPDARGIYVGHLDGTSNPQRLVASDAGAVYASSGHLLFVRQGTLYSQRFDASNLKLSGTASPVAEDVGSGRTDSALSVSDGGSIAYRSRSAPVERQFAWFDRSGKEISRVGEAVTRNLAQPSLSPDGQRVVLYGNPEGNPDIWIFETKRGVFSRFTTHPADDVMPAWSPDGASIVFSSNRNGDIDLYRASIGDRSEDVLLSSPERKIATDWSRDGSFLLFTIRDLKTSADIWALSMDANRKRFPVVQTPSDEEGAQFSPDGRWIAYQSNNSGRPEIYIRPFQGPGQDWQISTKGGTQVRWAPDGKEVFYVGLDGALTAVRIGMPSNAQVPEIGTPVALFTPPLGRAAQQGDYRHQYMVAADGRFLLAVVTASPAGPIALILNWKPRP